MPVNADPRPLNTFTVEQLMLIRKLKESGISKEQVAYVFDSYDRLDRELGSLFNIPVALALQAQTLQRIALHGQVPDLSSFSGSGSTSADLLYQMPAPTTSSYNTGLQQLPAASCSSSKDTRTNTLNNLLSTDLPMSFEPELQEFVAFIGKGDAACCEEIRSFVIRHGIKQQQIAILSGICQSYVSRFLKGDLYEMSERSRHAICKWYLKYRPNPALIGPAANLASMFNNASNDTNPLQLSQKKYFDPASLDLNAMANNPSISELLGCQRRERFVFRTCQVEILEKYFQECSYPTPDIRAEIAAACNTALEESVGRKLSERETVTVQIVSNWFANKRKDLKKAAREGGHDISELLLRSRGRPPQLFYYSGAPNERDSSDFDNGNFASDDSTSEVDHYSRGPLQEESKTKEATGSTIVKVEAAYGDDCGVVEYGNPKTCHDLDSLLTFPEASGFPAQLNGIDWKSSSIILPNAGSALAPDMSFVTAASGHA